MDVATEHPSLRRYDRTAIEACAATLLNRAQAGVMGQLDLAQEMLAFAFRDQSGGWWFLDASTGQWHQLGAADWIEIDRVPAMLEGRNGLPVKQPSPPQQAEATQETMQPTSPIVALADAIDDIVASYGEGRVDSQTTWSLLARRFLIDKQGRAWTVGAHSAKWYLFQEGQWKAHGAPPAPEALARLHPPIDPCPGCGEILERGGPCPACGTIVPPRLDGVDSSAKEAVLTFLIRGAGRLPEPVTEPWSQPPGYPNVTLPAVTRQVPLRSSVEIEPTPHQAVPPAAPKWSLYIKVGPTVSDPEHVPQRIDLDRRLRIGREPENDLALPSPHISRHHAVIEPASAGYRVVDLESTNGTLVNGQPIAAPTTIQPGDTILLHDTQLTVAGEGSLDRCPQCGEPVQPGRNFCTECGASLV